MDREIEINGFTFKESEIVEVVIERNGAHTTITRPDKPERKIGFEVSRPHRTDRTTIKRETA
jgi:hypothetical protein